MRAFLGVLFRTHSSLVRQPSALWTRATCLFFFLLLLSNLNVCLTKTRLTTQPWYIHTAPPTLVFHQGRDFVSLHRVSWANRGSELCSDQVTFSCHRCQTIVPSVADASPLYQFLLTLERHRRHNKSLIFKTPPRQPPLPTCQPHQLLFRILAKTAVTSQHFLSFGCCPVVAQHGSGLCEGSGPTPVVSIASPTICQEPGLLFWRGSSGRTR